MRYTVFEEGEFYHIYNRGVDKRNIFEDKEDLQRFLNSMEMFNTVDIIGSIYEKSREDDKFGSLAPKKLVNIIAYCLNQNHFHFILEPLVENGVQKFMHRISTGYTNYFNEKNDRSGSLFQGTYKAKHISSNEYLLYLGVYVNLNNMVHEGMNKLWMRELPFSSFAEYSGEQKNGICKKDIILDQFKSSSDFIKYSKDTLPLIRKRKEDLSDFKSVCID